MHSVSIIGVGRVGGALSLALPADKYAINDLVVRDRDRWFSGHTFLGKAVNVKEITELSSIFSDIVIIATQDSEIEAVVARLLGLVGRETSVFHTSGSLSSSILSPFQSQGCPVGSIHPLVSLSEPGLGAIRLKGSYFCIEGDDQAVEIARTIVGDLGGKPFTINADKKGLYHAAAVMAAGHVVALIDTAIDLMSKCGADREFAKTILMPLVESTVSNLETQSPARALTGTFSRADVDTFERHLAALRANASDGVRDIYLLLGDVSLDLALKNGADPAAVGEIRERISMAKS